MKGTKTADLLQDAVRHMNDGKYSRAFALLKDLLAKDPSHQEGRRLLASLLLKFGNLATARGAFDALVKEAIQRSDFPEAETLLREYLASGPRCVPFLEALGHVYELKGDPYAAVFEYEKAVDVLLEDPDPDRPAYAQELYEKITQLAPSSFVANRVAARFKEASPLKRDPPSSEAPSLPAEQESKPESSPADLTIESASPPAEVANEPERRHPGPEHGPESSVSEEAEEALSAETSTPDSVEQPQVRTAIPQSVGSPVRDRNDDQVPFPPVNQPLRLEAEASREEAASEDAGSEEQGTDLEEQRYDEMREMEGSLEAPQEFPEARQESPEDRQELHEVRKATPESDEGRPGPRPDFPDARHEPPEKDPERLVAATPRESISHDVLPTGPPELSTPRFDAALMSNSPVCEPAERLLAEVPEEASAPLPPEPPVVHSAASHDMRMAEPALLAQETASTSASFPEAASKPKRRPSRPKVGRAISTWVAIRVSIVSRKVCALTNSVTKLTVFLCVTAISMVLLLFGATAAGWLFLEQKPSDQFTALNHVSMPKALDDPKHNGYILMLGMDADGSVDAAQAGYDRWLGTRNESDEGCYSLTGSGEPVLQVPIGMQTPAGWMRSSDPVMQFSAEAGRIKGQIDPHGILLSRYKQWLGLPFEDWGFGNSNVPHCGLFLGVHRLYLAEGFVPSVNAGLERLEADLTAWRNVLSKATTLSTKVMAVEGINDDVAIMAGLLTRPSLDNKVLQRIIRLAKPLQEEERALRWPMHHEFRQTVKQMDARLRPRGEDQPVTALIVARMPVPKQRVLNGYAAYYDALLKIEGTPKAPPPIFYDFAHVPVQSGADYIVNPIDNLIGAEPIVNWDAARGMILEADARLRLAGLITRLRSGNGSNMASLVAQAGHTFYDPFTELPMLMNPAERTVYSVGKNRKDDGGNPASDVTLKFLLP